MHRENDPVVKVIGKINNWKSDRKCNVDYCGKHCRAAVETAEVMLRANSENRLTSLTPKDVYQQVDFVPDCLRALSLHTAINMVIDLAQEQASSRS